MAKLNEKLEVLFAKVRDLPAEHQELAVEMLSEIADGSTYTLSAEERAVLEPARERIRRGEFASHADVGEVFDKPWS